MHLGIVDLGTNSVRFAVYETVRRGQVLCVFKEKLMLKPGQGVFSEGRLEKMTMHHILLAFSHFNEFIAGEYGFLPVFAYATSAMREAQNAKSFCQLVLRKTGIKIEVISGQKEAALIALGVKYRERRLPKESLLIDIGGGSTEISHLKNAHIKTSKSLRLGVARLQQLYPLYEQTHLNPTASIALREHIRFHLRTFQPMSPAPIAIGTAGTIKAISRLIDFYIDPLPSPKKKRKKKKSSRNQGLRSFRTQFTKDHLEALILFLAPKSLGQLRDLKGLEPKRADQILGGAILLQEMLNHFKISVIRISEATLRDGLVVESLKNI